MAPLYDPPEDGRRTPRPASTSSSFPTFPAPIRWSGCGRARRRKSARRKASASATRTSGRAPAPGARAAGLPFRPGRGGAPVPRRGRSDARGPQSDIWRPKRWSYGPPIEKASAAREPQEPGRDGGGWKHCGSNTFPAGTFPDCHSPLGLRPERQCRRAHEPAARRTPDGQPGSRARLYRDEGQLVHLRHVQAHEDWCRWRAPFWHGSRVMDEHSHENYHLGFRCCKTLDQLPSRQCASPNAVVPPTRTGRMAPSSLSALASLASCSRSRTDRNTPPSMAVSLTSRIPWL